MTYQDGYICPICGPVKAKLAWNEKENDVVAYCTNCKTLIQVVIPQPTRIPLKKHGEAEG